MSKKITEMTTVTVLENTDMVTGVDMSQVDPALKNVQITKANLLTEYALDTDVAAVASDLSDHKTNPVKTDHTDAVDVTELNSHKSAANQHPISGVTGLQTVLDEKEDIANLGNAAYRNVGILGTDVAAGDAPAAVVTAHDGNAGAHGGNLPTTNQKAALDGAATALSGANPVVSEADDVQNGSELGSDSELADRILVSDGLGGFIYENKPAAGGSPTDLATVYDASGDFITITSSTGNNAVVLAGAPSGDAGVLTGAQAQKLADQPDQQVTAPEKTAGIELALRTFAPKDVADMVAAHESPTPGTDLSNTPAPTTVSVNSSTGDNTVLPAVVPGGNAGVMTGAQATKLADQPDQQVTAPEKTAGTELALRTFSPKDVADMAGIHGGGGGAGTDLGNIPASTTVEITSSTGDNTILPSAVASGDAGVMTGAQAQAVADNTSTLSAHVGDAGIHVPAGGTTDQVLSKASNADGDTVWADPPSGGAGTNLGNIPAPTTVDVTSSTGTPTTLPAAVAGGNAGVLTGAQAQAIEDNTSGLAAKLDAFGGLIANYGEDDNNLGSVSGIANLDTADGVVQYGAMADDTTFTLINSTGHNATSLSFLMASGGYTATFSGVTWAGATPDLSANATYLLAFFLINATWYGVLAG